MDGHQVRAGRKSAQAVLDRILPPRPPGYHMNAFPHFFLAYDLAYLGEVFRRSGDPDLGDLTAGRKLAQGVHQDRNVVQPEKLLLMKTHPDALSGRRNDGRHFLLAHTALPDREMEGINCQAIWLRRQGEEGVRSQESGVSNVCNWEGAVSA